MGWDSAAAAARSGWRVHGDAQSGLTNDTSGWSTSAGGSGAQASQSQGGVSGRRDWQFQQSNGAWNAGGEYGRSNVRGGNGRGRYSKQGRAPPPHIQRAGEGGYDRPHRQHNGNGNGEGGDRRPRREDRVDMAGDGVSDQGGWGKNDGGGGGNGGGGGEGEGFGGRCGFSGRGRGRGRGRGSFGGDGSGRGGDGYSTARNHRGGGYVGGGGDGCDTIHCDNGDDYGGGYGAQIPRPGYGGRGMLSGYDSRRRPPMRDSGPYMADLAPIDFSRVELPPFQKDFYTEHKNVTSRSDSEIKEWRKFKKITVVGKAPRPAHNWVEAMLPDFVLEYIKKKGFLEPTAIQSQGFPMALSGNDLVAISETGSGKTLAYAAPGILHVQAQPPTDAASGPIALVMAPTRELAMQILAEFRAIGEGSPVTSACAYGGVSKMRQLADIANGVDILVATPGRLLGYLAEGSVTLKRVTYLVVDEADRMIHEGFEEELRQIFSCVRPDRQVLMFSATWPEEVRDLAQEFLKDAARVHIGKDEIVAAKNIKQEVVICHGYMDKRDKLVQILEDIKAQRGKIVVFLNTKRSVQEMTDWLRDKPNNYEALCLHGDKRQEERDFALNEFRKGGHPILLATDVAQRGLDIPDVTTVCNFDVPDNVASYVHRIGRTARAGREGRSFTLVSGSRDRAMAAEIVKVMQRDEQIIPEELEEYAREDALFAPIETSTPFTDTLAASTSNEAAPAAWGSASSASTSSWGVPAAKSDEASTGAGWGPSDAKGDKASGPSSEQTPKPWGKTANEVQKDEDSTAAGYDSGYGGSSPETSPAKSTTWGRSSSSLSPTELDHNVVESHTLETVDEEVRPEDFLAKMVATGDADSDGGSGTITPTEAAKLEADLDKVSLDNDA